MMLAGTLLAAIMARTVPADAVPPSVPILVYHRFGATVADSMTVRTSTFAHHLAYMAKHGHCVISLHAALAYLAGPPSALPARALVVTADDGHRSVFEAMLPLVLRYRVPVTLFVYPSAISKAAYALSWQQLRVLQDSGWFDIESHTYWHPNFRQERKRLQPQAYRRFVAHQLDSAKDMLQRQLNRPVDLLAWPFGIVDEELERAAANAGYVAAFGLDRHAASPHDRTFALPRFLMQDADGDTALARMLGTGAPAGERAACPIAQAVSGPKAD